MSTVPVPLSAAASPAGSGTSGTSGTSGALSTPGMAATSGTLPLSRTGIPDTELREVLDGAAPLWSALQGAHLLLTGATGWFGTWLLDALVAANREHGLGLRITAVARTPGHFAGLHPDLHGAAEIDWRAADVREPLALAAPPTHVIHAATAASAALNRARPDVMFDTAAIGTRRVLEAAAGGACQSFLLLSSGAVYGTQPPALAGLPETWQGGPDPANVGNAYAEGKRAAEQYAAIAHALHGVPVRIARCFAFVGPHMPFDTHFAIGNFIANGVDRAPVVVKSDGSPRRSWLYMTDLVVWLLTVLVKGEVMRPYNVGSDESTTVGAVAQRIAAACGVECRIEGRPGEPAHAYVPDVGRIVAELGVRRTVDLELAIARTCRWRPGQVGQGRAVRGDIHG